MQLIAYLAFDGRCKEAFQYYEKHLRGKIAAMIPYEDSPGEQSVAAEDAKKIMHARLEIGEAVLMGGDAPGSYFRQPQGFSVSIMVEDLEDAQRIFAALSDGGKVMMPFAKTFWAKRFGMCIDKFGTPWMVNGGMASRPDAATGER